MNNFVKNSLLIDFEVDTSIHLNARLKEIGMEKGYVTDDDMCHFFRETEQNTDLLEQIYVTFFNAGILLLRMPASMTPR